MKRNKSHHGGNVRALALRAGVEPSTIVDFSANINPLDPPVWLKPLLANSLDLLSNYPDSNCEDLCQTIAERFSLATKNIIVGNGSSEILYIIPGLKKFNRAIINSPTYGDYERACKQHDLETCKISPSVDLSIDLSQIEKNLNANDLVFITNPNNPTSLTVDSASVVELVRKHGSTVFVIDEAFIEFTDVPSVLDSYANEAIPENLIVLRSLTKFYAIPGLRLGFAVAGNSTAIRIREKIGPWSVNALAQKIGMMYLTDKIYRKKTKELVTKNRRWLFEKLSEIPELLVYPGKANFLLIRIADTALMKVSASSLAETLLLKDHMAIRDCSNFNGLDEHFFRVAVKTHGQNQKLYQAICREFGFPSKVRLNKKKPALMFQGCSSDSGKSFLSTALCRILVQEGIKTAPFKAQNMSLNSFVPHNGEEMGRAQVVQAKACRLEPDIRMNPILLKPNSDTGCQIIVNGKPIGNQEAKEYSSFKRGLFKKVTDAYDSLTAEHEVIILEGAGSPAEINLRKNDIVNMRMALYADAGVLLCGDIDRGGVFASLTGTLELMEERERNLIRGFILNKFRGDASLLKPAIDFMSNTTGKETLGVIPWIHESRIPEEDSVTLKNIGFGSSPDKQKNAELRIAVIDLGHISNFTDLDPLRIEPDVSLSLIKKPEELFSNDPSKRFDALILPGSKNVHADLEQLKRRGTAQAIIKIAKEGTSVIGICAGYQMLGKTIKDPHSIESKRKEFAGLGLLNISTIMHKEKELTRTRAVHLPSGLRIGGYEIHHGRSEVHNEKPFIKTTTGNVIGVSTANDKIWGSYLHGIFDDDTFRRFFLNSLRQAKGLEALRSGSAIFDLDKAIDSIADVFRRHVDMKKIFEMLRI